MYQRRRSKDERSSMTNQRCGHFDRKHFCKNCCHECYLVIFRQKIKDQDRESKKRKRMRAVMERIKPLQELAEKIPDDFLTQPLTDIDQLDEVLQVLDMPRLGEDASRRKRRFRG